MLFGAQRETLIRQLDTNTEEIESTVQELDMHEESEEQNYQMLVVFVSSPEVFLLFIIYLTYRSVISGYCLSKHCIAALDRI